MQQDQITEDQAFIVDCSLLTHALDLLGTILRHAPADQRGAIIGPILPNLVK